MPKQLDSEPLLVNVKAAADILSLGRTTVYQLMASGQLRSIKIGSARRIPMQAIREWVTANTPPNNTEEKDHG